MHMYGHILIFNQERRKRENTGYGIHSPDDPFDSNK